MELLHARYIYKLETGDIVEYNYDGIIYCWDKDMDSILISKWFDIVKTTRVLEWKCFMMKGDETKFLEKICK
jgi:hypothetical protein